MGADARGMWGVVADKVENLHTGRGLTLVVSGLDGAILRRSQNRTTSPKRTLAYHEKELFSELNTFR